MNRHPEKKGLQTLAVHGGEGPDPVTKASAPAIVMSTAFIADPDASFSVEGLGEDPPYVYTRWGNPTIKQLETKLAALEESEACIAFASGMAAITALFLHHLKSGDHMVMSDIAYAAASEFAHDLLPELGVNVTRVNMTDLEAVRSAVAPGTRLIYAETPCNPILRLTDLEAVGRIAREAGAKLAVDSTFATPVATRPMALGADIVIHSLTKYMCGHGDALGGALLGSIDDIEPMRKRTAIRAGGTLSPFNAWLIMRGIATLPLRMRAHEEGALSVASFLESHPRVKRVVYPGLSSHPQHDLARAQMRNFSGMLTFQTEDGPSVARVLSERLKIFHYAVSLGHHRSLIFYLDTQAMQRSSFRLTPEQLSAYREYAGDGLFRVSAGLEDPEDLCRDLDQALAHI